MAKKALAFVLTSLAITFVGIAIWNRLSKRSAAVSQALAAR